MNINYNSKAKAHSNITLNLLPKLRVSTVVASRQFISHSKIAAPPAREIITFTTTMIRTVILSQLLTAAEPESHFA